MATNDGSNGWKKAVGLAEAVIGTAFVLRGLKAVFGEPPQSPLLGAGLRGASPDPMLRGTAVRSASLHTVKDIDERVRYIAEMTRRSSVYPQTREDAMAVLTKKCNGKTRWCVREKDDRGEILALFSAVRRVSSPLAVRYTGDHVFVDQFQHYRVTRETHGGDCDDQTVFLGSMLMTVGFHVRLRVVHTRGDSTWNHIYFMVGLPRLAPTHWMALDLTVKSKPAGWQVSGADEAARTGRPAGEVEAVRDYEMRPLTEDELR